MLREALNSARTKSDNFYPEAVPLEAHEQEERKCLLFLSNQFFWGGGCYTTALPRQLTNTPATKVSPEAYNHLPG